MAKLDDLLERLTNLVSDIAANRASENTSDRMTEISFDTLVSKRSSDARIREFQRRCDDVLIVSKILGRPPQDLKLYKELFDPITEIRKALDTATYADWIPTGFSAELFHEVELELKVASLHPRIQMPTNPFNIPISSGKVLAQVKQTEGQSPAETTFRTPDKIVLNAVPLIASIGLTYELEEDSIVPVLPLIRKDIVQALARAQETATINGDTDGSLDGATPPDPRTAWNGYRSLVESDAYIDANGQFDIDILRYARSVMGPWGVNPDDLAWVVSIAGYNQMLSLEEVMTVDKYGPNATLLRGELGKLDNIPIIVSEYVPDNLDSAGKNAGGVGNDKTIIILVNRTAFVYGDRREVLVETDKDIAAQTTMLVASQRVAFAKRVADGNPVVAIIYNVPTVPALLQP